MKRNTLFLSVIFLFLMLLSLRPLAFLQHPTISTASIQLSHSQVQPGTTLYAYITIQLAPKWHTYWKNPGESGAPLTLSWHLPQTISPKAIIWPPPIAFKTGPITSFGFKNQLFVAVPLTVSANIPHGQHQLSVTAKWLVCHDTCIPIQQLLTVPLQISTSSKHTLTFNHLKSQLAAQQAFPISEPAQFTQHNQTLWIKLPYELPRRINPIHLFPDKPLFNKALHFKQHSSTDSTYLSAKLPKEAAIPPQFTGILQFMPSDTTFNYQLTFQENPQITPPLYSISLLLKLLLFAFLGGAILNVMPCVFPILSLKALEVVQLSRTHQRDARYHAWAYTAGAVITLLGLSLILILFKSFGYQLGWGFHLQSPLFVTLLIWMLTFISLHLLGLLELPQSIHTTISRISTKGHAIQTTHTGLKKSFLTGVLATITATPCTAPFMATAIGAALITPPVISMTIFAMLGLGLASPFLLLSYMPSLQQKLPKPGQWMITFKKWLSLPMILSVVWLLWVLSQQTSPTIIKWIILSIINISILCMLFKKHTLKTWIQIGLIILTLIGMSLVTAHLILAPKVASSTFFSTTTVNSHINQHSRIFINTTAAWCITCQVNKVNVLETPEVQQFFHQHNIQVITADWTNYNTEITTFLNQFNRNGVPLYVFYNKDGNPILLPQILQKSSFINTLREHMLLERAKR